MADLKSDLISVLGSKTAKALAADFEMRSVGDLLRHYPRRYVNRSVLTPLADLQVDEHVTVMAEIRSVELIQGFGGGGRGRRPKNRLLVDVTDGSADLRLTFFNQAWRQKDLRPGSRGLFSGKVGEYRGARQLTHPDYLIQGGKEAQAEAGTLTAAVIAIYPATAKVSSWTIANSVNLALDSMTNVSDPLPGRVLSSNRLMGLFEALDKIHRPHADADWHRARERLKYDEALLMQLVLARRRQETKALTARQRPRASDGIADAFDTQLPFPLTAGQLDVGAEIAQDLDGHSPMHRLLQGDVGSGKTIVALRAMLQVVSAGGQAVLLTPTEVLAQQHFRVITDTLGPLAQEGTLLGGDVGTRVVLLTASLNAKQRRAALLEIASGAAGIVIGTHSLLQDTVQYADLGLVVVDEQHRFGVEQRAALTTRSGDVRPHVLVMTATPIPRTIAMTVFGDLEISTLSQRPPGRAGTVTHVVGENDKDGLMGRTWTRAMDEVKAANQVFVVCPRIDEDEVAGTSPDGSSFPMHSVEEVYRRLGDGPLKGARLGQLHGRQPSELKDETMGRFSRGPELSDALDVMVATTVIEVGVDVPNATMMVILDADRFGVSQLHQLRGRVGRGSKAGLCLLVTQQPAGAPPRERLDAVSSTEDGFELARLDLDQRREGDILGASQSGHMSSLKLLSVLRDETLISGARNDADELVAGDAELVDHPGLRALVADFESEQNAEYLEKG